MREALRLAARARGRTHPNPMVGALVVRGGRIVGQGYHRKAGGPHAEVLALQAAGSLAHGGTLYVSLEPCCHFGRTPPCTEAILSAGIREAVIGMRDPNPLVSGGGIRALRRAGVRVRTGLLEEECRRLNEDFCHYIRTGRPFVILKSALSLDGKIATSSGESRWISSPQSRSHTHRLRERADAILVGIGTILADDPSLTARPPGGRARDPLRVILDSRLKIPLTAKILNVHSKADTILATTRHSSPRRRAEVAAKGVEVLVLREVQEGVSLKDLLRVLGRRGIVSLLIEGGAKVSGEALRAGVVNKVIYYLAPILIGGERAPGAIGGEGVHRLADAYRLRDVRTSRLGPDLLVEGYVDGGGRPRRVYGDH